MNINRLKAAEEDFLIREPRGFNSPEMIEIGKKHKMDQMIAQTQDAFSEERFTDAQGAAEMMTKLVSRSSMVSSHHSP